MNLGKIKNMVIFLMLSVALILDCVFLNKYFSAEAESQFIAKQWVDKKCAVLGSSLTSNGGWTDILEQRFGFGGAFITVV